MNEAVQSKMAQIWKWGSQIAAETVSAIAKIGWLSFFNPFYATGLFPKLIAIDTTIINLGKYRIFSSNVIL